MAKPSPIRVMRPNPGAPRLFCFPYAGANRLAFQSWIDGVPGFEVCAYEPPGRGSRITEQLVPDIEVLASEAITAMSGMLERRYVLFGHSMGGLLAFKVAARLHRQGYPSPAAVIISATSAPSHHTRHDGSSDREVVERLEKLNGAPMTTWSDPEFLELFLPILRADVCVCDSFVAEPGERVRCDLFLFGGRDDPEVSTAALSAWSSLGSHQTVTTILDGNHFFPWNDPSTFFDHLNRALSPYCPTAVVGGARERVQAGTHVR